MKGEIKASISAIAAAVMLVACASKGPASPTAMASAGAQDETSSEVQRLIDNASEQRVCKRQAVTGSRIDSQVCLTRAEMEEQRQYADQVLREIRESAASRQPVQDRPQMPSTPPPSP
jgi:hypothetical protein